MSKHIKGLVTQDLSRRLEGVQDALVVDVIGMPANETVALRKDLREKNIHLLVVKSSLARRATEGMPLAAALDSAEGSLAIMWGSEDIVSLAKEAIRLDGDAKVVGFQAKGGVLDGETLSHAKLKEISKWPNREEQLSLLSGQVLSPGAKISGALLGPGSLLASQVKQVEEKAEAGD